MLKVWLCFLVLTHTSWHSLISEVYLIYDDDNVDNCEDHRYTITMVSNHIRHQHTYQHCTHIKTYIEVHIAN